MFPSNQAVPQVLKWEEEIYLLRSQEKSKKVQTQQLPSLPRQGCRLELWPAWRVGVANCGCLSHPLTGGQSLAWVFCDSLGKKRMSSELAQWHLPVSCWGSASVETCAMPFPLFSLLPLSGALCFLAGPFPQSCERRRSEQDLTSHYLFSFQDSIKRFGRALGNLLIFASVALAYLAQQVW